jgi:TPR repeat protein
VSQDDVEMVKWFRKAAEQGDAASQHLLGAVYASGRGVPQDFIQAHMWFNLAASRYPSGETRDKVAKFRDKLAGHMTPAQIAEAQRLAREWKPK